MLPLIERLKRPSLFTRAYSARKSVTTPIFTLYVLPRQERVMKANSLVKCNLPMVGFVVSKKVSKSACRRNKMKRRLREAYRTMQAGTGSEMPQVTQSLSRWYVMVLVIKENILNLSWSDIRTTMENAFLEAARRYG